MRLIRKALSVYREEGPGMVAKVIIGRCIPPVIGQWGRVVERRGNNVNVQGFSFDVSHPSIKRVIKGSVAMGLYERPEKSLVKRFLPKDTPVIELGGCIGVVSCAINRQLQHPANHVVVEANPELVPVIERNRDANACAFSVEWAALAHGHDEVTFYIHESIHASSTVAKTGSAVNVPACTLRSLAEKYRFSSFSVVCDIEGGEDELIRNEGDFLAHHAMTFIAEIHPNVLGPARVRALHERLQDLGFRLEAEMGNVCCYINTHF